MAEITLSSLYTTAVPFHRTLGPRQSPRIAIVGEALGEQEDLTGAPFSGSSGQELTRLLREAGIDRSQCFLTNALSFRPQNNDIEQLCVSKAEAGFGYPMPPMRQGKYLHPKFIPEVERLRHEIASVKPNLILALGNTACWALLYRTNIGSIRGTISESVLVPGAKVLPTYHPAAVLRQWSFRPIVLADLLKGARECEFPEVRRPERWVIVQPTLGDIESWVRTNPKPSLLGVDIETSKGQITMIGFARSRSDALVVPFVDPMKLNQSYWDCARDEKDAWLLVRSLIESPIPKVFQNGVYDLQYIMRMGFRPRNCLHDTMLKHHALYPELKKGLGFLGSIYTDEAAWKLMRHNEVTTKKDE